jgi:PAS domain S-box-containing protein
VTLPLRVLAKRDKALVVDDDPAVCETLASMLVSSGFEPESYLHPQAALAGLRSGEYRIAFLDVNLPMLSGLDLLRKLQESCRIEDVIFMSASDSFNQVLQAIKLGAYDYLKKPFASPELKALLERLSQKARLQDRIEQAELKYYTLIQNIPLLIFALNELYDLEFINQACATLFGCTPEEALQAKGWFLRHVHPEDKARVRDAFKASFERGSPFSLECRMLHKKGTETHGILRSIPGVAENGAGCKLARLEAVFIDITDRVVLERALVQNEKLKTLGAISSEVAHEVRNPLMSIAGFARRLEKKAPDYPEVGIILREALRLEKLLNRIREYLRPVEASLVSCRADVLLSECLHFLYPELREKEMWCEADLPELAPVLADPEYLRQVFVNIIRFGILAVDRDAIFTVSGFETERTAHISFRKRMDNAENINPELLFMPFDESGQVAGLPLCYRLVKYMGGALSFHSEQGYAIFTVSLPRFNGGTGSLAERGAFLSPGGIETLDRLQAPNKKTGGDA